MKLTTTIEMYGMSDVKDLNSKKKTHKLSKPKRKGKAFWNKVKKKKKFMHADSYSKEAIIKELEHSFTIKVY